MLNEPGVPYTTRQEFFDALDAVQPILVAHVAKTNSARAQKTLSHILDALNVHDHWPATAFAMIEPRDHKRIGRALRVHRAQLRAKDLQSTRVARGRLVARCRTKRAATEAAAREQSIVPAHSHLRTLSTDVFRAMLLNGYLLERCRLCERWAHCKNMFREMRPPGEDESKKAAVCGDCTRRYAAVECAHCAIRVFDLDGMLRRVVKIGYVSRPGYGADWQFFCDDEECSAPPADSSDYSSVSSSEAPVCDMCGNQCDTDDGWHVRDRPHTEDIYCDDCFQRSPYQVCFRCDKWVDMDQHKLHRVEDEHRFEMMICDECENARILAAFADKK